MGYFKFKNNMKFSWIATNDKFDLKKVSLNILRILVYHFMKF